MEEAGKRVSWFALYLDLVFVLAVGQLAHLIVERPERHSVWIALAPFFTLWWTWVGFAVLYNRRGADHPRQRVRFLIGSVPAGVAAAAVAPAAAGDAGVFAAAMAATRVIQAFANAAEGRDSLLQHRIARAWRSRRLLARLHRRRHLRAGHARVPARHGVRPRCGAGRRGRGEFAFGRLAPAVSAHAYLWVLTGWVAVCAVLTSRRPASGPSAA